MKALVTCSELSGIKFEDFAFDVSPSLFLNSCEFELATQILTCGEDGKYDKEWDKFCTDYEVHKCQVLHRELIEKGILGNDTAFMGSFNSDDLYVSPQEFLDKVYLKFEITIF